LPNLIYHRDHAQWHANLAHVKPVGQPPAVDHLAHRIGQRDDLLDRARDRIDARLIQRQPV
jgi:hypothetical protein